MDQDTKKMTRTAIYVAAGGYLLYLAYQLFGRLFGIRQLILLAKNGASEFDKQPGPSEQDLSENVSSENEDNSEK